MTKRKARNILYKAAEVIETHRLAWSCNTLSYVETGNSQKLTKLRKAYTKFYGFDKLSYERWDDLNNDNLYQDEENKGRRVIMLLLFAEAGL